MSVIRDDSRLFADSRVWDSFCVSTITDDSLFSEGSLFTRELSGMIAVYLLVRECGIALAPVLLQTQIAGTLLPRHLTKLLVRFFPCIHILWLIRLDRK